MDGAERTNLWLTHDWLDLLDPDPSTASEKYRELSQGLVRYFEWNHGDEPEDMAQETLQRGFRKLGAGTPITIDDPRGYFWGIAYNVLREGWKARPKIALEDKEVPIPGSTFRRLNRTEQAIFLEECLRKLPKADVDMLVAYTEGRGAAWASANKLTPGALRLRIHRIRNSLEQLAGVGKQKKMEHFRNFRHV
jgi:DNA-directed RNA polymerase specialized sigma24 family protein